MDGTDNEHRVPGSILDRPEGGSPPDPASILVAGATGGIGNAFCNSVSARFPAARIVRMARDPAKLPPLGGVNTDIAMDIGDQQLIEDAVQQLPRSLKFEWAFIATGWLHDHDRQPEKTFKHLDSAHMLQAYRINAVGPALLLKNLLSADMLSSTCRMGILSARVGSISDNRLGGWHAYRASKAALNMLIKNFAIELARKRNRQVVVGLQPGTTDTPLSAPFQRNVPAGELQTADYTAKQLIKVMQRLRPEDSGGLFDFLGLPFDP